MNTQESKTSFIVEVVVIVLLTIVWVAIAQADDSTFLTKGDRTFSVVRYLGDVPRGECRYVQFPPRPLDSMEFPEPHLFCNTMDAIGMIDEPIATRQAPSAQRRCKPY